MNEALEALNGVWAILAGFAVLFTILHLNTLLRWGDKTFREYVHDIGFQLAVTCAIICLGVAVSRSAIWQWRYSTGGDLSQLASHAVPIGVGALIGSVGFLLYIRVVTKPFGAGPTIVALVAAMAYLATFLF